jgi:hypothetical protein
VTAEELAAIALEEAEGDREVALLVLASITVQLQLDLATVQRARSSGYVRAKPRAARE